MKHTSGGSSSGSGMRHGGLAGWRVSSVSLTRSDISSRWQCEHGASWVAEPVDQVIQAVARLAQRDKFRLVVEWLSVCDDVSILAVATGDLPVAPSK
jgi:hypothetical protein